MEDQENSIREENFIQNETEKFFETDEEFEKNEILSNFSGSHILNTSKNNGEKASLNQNDNVLDESNLTKELQVQEISSKNEMKNIEILDLNQQASDDIDRPFLFASQQSLKLDNQHFNNSKLDDSPKENSLEKETFDREKFSLNNKNKEVVGLNSGKLTKSAVKYDHTELKLRKTILTYQRHSSKFQFKTVSDQGKSIDRLSCLPIRKIEHYNVKTIHDKLKGVDVDALSSRLYNSKIHGGIKMNDFYSNYFSKKIRSADPSVVSERLSAKYETRVPDSCRTIKSSPLKRNDLCVSWAWRGYN